jgi:hypothetical protein
MAEDFGCQLPQFHASDLKSWPSRELAYIEMKKIPRKIRRNIIPARYD